MEKAFLTDLIKVMDLVVLEHVEDDRFQLSGNVPEWFERLYPDAAESERGLKPGRKFLFLANFLMDAAEFWESEESGRLKSGSWIESDSKGKQYQVEATAVTVNGKKFLLMESSQYSHKEKQFMIQKGHELNFEYKLLEAFEKEQLRNQQELQEEVKARTEELVRENIALRRQNDALEKRLQKANKFTRA